MRLFYVVMKAASLRHFFTIINDSHQSKMECAVDEELDSLFFEADDASLSDMLLHNQMLS